MPPSKHEQKACPRCGHLFECKPGDVLHCQCYGITLDDATRQRMAELYTDCICARCMRQLMTTDTIPSTD